jgi:hypothetical protein
MQTYEYKAVPAPARGEKARGLKTGSDRFAHAVTLLLNAMARDGWEYQRAETLPSEERTGFTGRTTVYHSVMVFRRAVELPVAAAAPEQGAMLLTAPWGGHPQPLHPTLGSPLDDKTDSREADPAPVPKLGPARS